MPKPQRENHDYVILVPSLQGRTIAKKATSPEMACQQLQRQIAGKEREATDISSDLVWDVWSDPSEPGEEWLIVPVVKDARNPDEIMSWNGKALTTHCEIGNILRRATIKKREE
jgi:hypothetical protein